MLTNQETYLETFDCYHQPAEPPPVAASETAVPFVAETGPVVVETGPVVVGTGPVVVGTGPVVIETDPVVIETDPVVIETDPVAVSTVVAIVAGTAADTAPEEVWPQIDRVADIVAVAAVASAKPVDLLR